MEKAVISLTPLTECWDKPTMKRGKLAARPTIVNTVAARFQKFFAFLSLDFFNLSFQILIMMFCMELNF